MNPYLEKIQGFGAPRKWGKAEKKPVTNEDNGKSAGHYIEHWDDHVDAVATPSMPRLTIKRGAMKDA